MSPINWRERARFAELRANDAIRERDEARAAAAAWRELATARAILRDPKFYTARTKRAVTSLTIERGPKVVPHE